jgi:hypothetical protein
LVLRFFHDVLQERDLAVVADVFAPDVVDHRPEGVVRGVDALTGCVRRFLGTFADLSMSIHGIAIQSPLAMVWHTWRGTCLEGCGWLGQRGLHAVECVSVFRLETGRIAERWEYVRPRDVGTSEHGLSALAKWSQLVPGERFSLRVRW